MKRIFRRSDARPNATHDVGDEIDFHLDMRAREFMEAGMSPEDARAEAARVFGNAAAIDAELRVARDAHVRTSARAEGWRELTGDVAFALRSLRKNVAFTVGALATLALGIGAATAVFTVVNGVLIRPLPYPDPSRLVMTWMSSKKYGPSLPFSSGFYNDFVNASRNVATTSAFRSWSFSLDLDGNVEQVSGARVTPSFFDVIGAKPRLGRAFVAADADSGASRVVIIGSSLWTTRFGADPAIIGKRITLAGEPFAIVGVMPDGFAFPRGAELPAGLAFAPRSDLWTPLTLTEADRKNYGTMNLSGISRLKPGATVAQLHAAASAQLKEFLAANAPTLDLTYEHNDLRHQASQHVRRGLLLLMGAVVLLLVIACANVTNLLISRTGSRAREFAVRAALGAGRLRIARQLITENVLLALCGTSIGLVFAIWATRVMLTMVPGSLPRADDIAVDWRVAVTALATTLVVGVVFGLAAATQVGWNKLAGTLRDEGGRSTGTRRRSTGRRALVIAEVSLSLILVIGASLLALSFARLQRVDPGFNPRNVFTASINLPVPGAFDFKNDGPKWAAAMGQLQERLSRINGVVAAGAVSAVPLTGTAEGGGTWTVGDAPPAPGQANSSQYLVIQGDYFKALGIPVVSGRAFDASDVATSTPVVIVNEEYVKRYMQGAALNRQLSTFFDFTRGQTPRTIVGVVKNVQYGVLDGPVKPQAYVPEQQMPYPGLQIVLRVNGDPMSVLSSVKREVKELDPRVAVSKARAAEDVFADALAQRRFSMRLILFFAGAALALAMVGLYGVVALNVNYRRREIGVRMAVGARPRDVLQLVLGEGMTMTAVGVLIGLLGAYAASRFFGSLLYDVSATNPLVYAGAAAVTIAITLAATFLPARRAAAVDPTAALRE